MKLKLYFSLLCEWVLGELLFLANAYPPIWKTEFYRLKDKILTDYGTWVGIHLQHVRHECFGCDGTGKKRHEAVVYGEERIWYGAPCPRCDGSGVYREFWTVLSYLQIGGRHFHIPRNRYYRREDVPEIKFDQEIEGYIRHDHPKYYLSAEAAFWLMLIFDSRLFWRHLGRSGYPSRKFTPMVILSTWIFDIRGIPFNIQQKINRLRWRIVNFRQEHCKHLYPVISDPSDWDRCQRCGILRHYAEDDIPF